MEAECRICSSLLPLLQGAIVIIVQTEQIYCRCCYCLIENTFCVGVFQPGRLKIHRVSVLCNCRQLYSTTHSIVHKTVEQRALRKSPYRAVSLSVLS